MSPRKAAAVPESEMPGWRVLYRRGRGPAEVWAAIEGVPAGTTVAEVAEALEQWSRWPAWQRRVAPGGHVEVKSPGSKVRVNSGHPFRLTWDQLAPESRKVGLTVSAALWADLRAEAAAADQSLASWCVDALAAAVETRKAARA